VNEAVNLANQWKGKYWARTTNALLRSISGSEYLLQDMERTSMNQGIRRFSAELSHPEWLVRRWMNQLGEDNTRHLCMWNNEFHGITVRVNRYLNPGELKTSEAEFIRPSPWMEEFGIVERGKDILFSRAFENGTYSIQDQSAGLVSCLVDPKPGEMVWDVCAAPGGKTNHLAEMSRCKTRIFSSDIQFHRILKAREGAVRLRLKAIHHLAADGIAPPFRRCFDKILLDVPCSGIGVLSSKPEIRWLRNPEDIGCLVSVQKNLMSIASSFLSPGGVMIYSTCTLLPEENEKNVEDFLHKNKDFTIENAVSYVDSRFVDPSGAIYTWPHIHDMDGSYAVRLKKRD
jgi:16S rRNA (cytosine967-C5)-methyltransferase